MNRQIPLIENVNINKHPIVTLHHDLKQIVAENFNGKIFHFSYQQINHDNTIAFLTTHPDVTEKYVRAKHYNYMMNAKHGEYQSGCYLWDDILPQTNNSYIQNRIKEHWDVIKQNKIGKGLGIIKQNQNETEIYYFATEINHGTNSFLLNILDEIKLFTNNFKTSNEAFIKKAYDHLVLRPVITIEETTFGKHNSHSSNFCFESNQVELTPRQKECINFIKQGASIKEIANKLQISSRTAEKHVLEIRQKFNCPNIKKLIIKLQGLNNLDI